VTVASDFREVAHTGGVATFHTIADAEGRLSYSVGYRHSSPRPMTLAAVYAHPAGFPMTAVKLGGIGEPFNPPPVPNAIVVMMASDSEGRFGHECPRCHKHFRSPTISAHFRLTCPYCGCRADAGQFLTPPQRSYVAKYIETLDQALDEVEPGSSKEIELDMNALADQVEGKPRPDFYYGSTTQQTQFKCTECGQFNDIRGRYGYCASCGWRNNAASLRASLDEKREKLNAGALTPSEVVKQAVSEFDSCARSFVEQLAARTPMKPARRQQLQDLLFHGLRAPAELLGRYFDINITKGINEAELGFLRMMFARRHVYEHNAGVATAKYLADSEDTSFEEGMLIRETAENAHRLVGNLNRMIETFSADFHEIFPPEDFCIRLHKDWLARQPKQKT